VNINSAFPSKFLAAADLNDRAVNVTISGVKMEGVGQAQEQKPVVYFQGKKKGLVLNKTNTKRIIGLVGSAETKEWIGKGIQIFPTETEYQGETVDCIRVRAVKAETPADDAPADDFASDADDSQPPPVTDDEIGF